MCLPYRLMRGQAVISKSENESFSSRRAPTFQTRHFPCHVSRFSDLHQFPSLPSPPISVRQAFPSPPRDLFPLILCNYLKTSIYVYDECLMPVVTREEKENQNQNLNQVTLDTARTISTATPVDGISILTAVRNQYAPFSCNNIDT